VTLILGRSFLGVILNRDMGLNK